MNISASATTGKHSVCPTWLFVLPWTLDHLGGVNQVVINLGREMLKLGSFEPIVLVADWEAVEPIWELVHGIKTIRWRIRPFRPLQMSIKERLSFALWEPRFRKAFQHFCNEQAVAVINCHYATPTAFTLHRLTSGANYEMKMIISFHGADLTAIRTSQSGIKVQWKKLLMQVSAVVSCSKGLGELVVDTFGNSFIPTVIHNGINSTEFIAMAGDSTPNPRLNILSVGKFEKKKGQDVLINAFSLIADDFSDVSLTLVGATDTALPQLRELCAEKGVQGRVSFFTDIPHSQIPEFFRQAILFALPSRQEPFGIVLLEAGSFSLPVVATNVGGIPEILTDGVTGRLVSPDDPEALAVTMRSLLNDPKAAKKMGKRLNQHVSARFTWAAAHDAYIKLVTGSQPSDL